MRLVINGSTNRELALALVRTCVQQEVSPSNADQFRLLLLDGHSSHANWRFIQYCLENDIIALCSPPHITHRLQPLDVGIFGPLTHHYGKLVDSQVRLGHTGITKADFLELYKQSRDLTMKPDTIQSRST